jgi:thiol-disulfide isomerase/thioredoxin
MKLFILSWLLVLGLATHSKADPLKGDLNTNGLTLRDIQQEWDEAETTFNKTSTALPQTPEGDRKRNELWKGWNSRQTDLAMKAVDLARSNPDSSSAFEALEWVMMQVRYNAPTGPACMQLLAEHHSGNPDIAKLIALLAYYVPHRKSDSHAEAVALLQSVAEKNPDRTARGHAYLGLATSARSKFEDAEFLSSSDLEPLRRAALEAYKKVLSEYGDCRYLRTAGLRPPAPTFGEEVTPEIYELEHLVAGNQALEINGVDLDDAPLRLIDYRGKVVLLVFWASWCGPCMGDVPHEKELVSRFKRRPFVLLGVNGDGDKSSARRAVKDNEINWRSFWNGSGGPGGSIARDWNIRGWPTIYVIDHQGVIRYRQLRGKTLDGPLEELVKAAEMATAPEVRR